MNRRRFLKFAAGTSPFIAGCTGTSNSSTPTGSTSTRATSTSTQTSVATSTDTATETPTETSEHTETIEHPPPFFVGPDGSDANEGTSDYPFATIEKALLQARPGETVRVLPGTYHEQFISERAGEPDAPITLTGAENAVLRPPKDDPGNRIFSVVHSHIHLRGMTFDGLADPERPTDPAAYSNNVIDAFPPQGQDDHPDYLSDIVIKPDAIGNARRHVLGTVRTNQVEIGEFRLIGPAGAENLYDEDAKDHSSGGIVAKNHIGEVIQIGAKHNVFDEGEGDWYQWDTPDESHDIHIHHIDNSEGHEHTELVELGTSVYDATIEYCTDAGGSGMYFMATDDETWGETSMALRGGRCTLRWCVIENGYGAGVHIGTPPGLDRNLDKYTHIPDSRFPGMNNSVYGNRIVDNAGLALAFPYELFKGEELDQGPSAQKVICGNEINGDTQCNRAKSCPDRFPETNTIGHLGGDTPWA